MSKKFDKLFRVLWMDKTVQLPASFRENLEIGKILKHDSVSVGQEYCHAVITEERAEYGGSMTEQIQMN